ncbi:thioesterase family protein [Halostagnicola sp. A-GB9-2]|uniref:acyl-CoA thioesterase n=1 Tax=Halostagnicola sp. A-GB9-2 TaxID=3048066 RepID=UPI0024BFA2F3|nr:thioesterase family protein [Halostagnicola sp. A-GB9-2]MDJ1434352.1 thioesterase family protein [Halostagnicola sp. A-GB9-2]
MFQHEWKCAWGEADPQGIAYYPRLINAMHCAGEEYMDDNGIAYWDIPEEYGVFLPIVAMDMEFERPVMVGDVLQISVEPEIGNKSLGMQFTATHEDGGTAYTGHEQHVCVSEEDNQSRPLPDEIKAILGDTAE